MHAGGGLQKSVPHIVLRLAVVNQWEMSQRELLMWGTVREVGGSVHVNRADGGHCGLHWQKGHLMV